jgi:4-diphosphocytidyl-2-C-methyl-D-erythritol kinase
VPTGPVFKGWDGVDRGALAEGDPLAAALAGRNDLQPPAVVMQPVIADVVSALAAMQGARLARMSGSGATCFALFGTSKERDAAQSAIENRFPAWWTLATLLR